MSKVINKSWIAIFFLFVFVLVSGCGNNDKNKKESPAPAVSGSAASVPNVVAQQAGATDTAISVDGKILKKSELEKQINEMMTKLKDKVPADKQKELRENVKKQVVNTFIIRALLANEIERRKIVASDQEIKQAKDKIQASLPPGKKIDEFFKEKGIPEDEVSFAVKIEKFMNMETANKTKPSQKEIAKFYKDNRDKFVEPESVHVRHILVATKKDDSDKVKAQKKEKIENLRKQLLNGGNFADLARQNSDCPSKEAGGDLNFIKRGQTVKPFEDAAFSQEKNVIGPVITTEFGYHIVQVLDRKPSKKVALEAVKEKISAYLEQQKKSETFNAILNNLKQKAKIVINQ